MVEAFILAEGFPSPLPMTAVQNSEKFCCYEQPFAVQESNQYTRVGHADGVIQLTINWVSLSILDNTMSSLLSMALEGLIQPYKRLGLIFPYFVLSNLVSNSYYNLPALFLIWSSMK